MTLTRPVDHEIQPVYEITVQANDGTTTALTCVNIVVDDVNDVSPTFTLPWFSFSLPEVATSGWHVGQVGAVDGDSGGAVTYSLLSYWAQDTFAIDPYTGIILLVGTLDYEQVQVKVKVDGEQ